MSIAFLEAQPATAEAAFCEAMVRADELNEEAALIRMQAHAIACKPHDVKFWRDSADAHRRNAKYWRERGRAQA